MSITTAGDNLIHYEALGRGRPVIFIHGWIGSWRYWWPSMQALSAHARTFALDLWGFGDSSKSPADYSLSSYVEMLDAFMERLGIVEPAVIVGHGLGSGVALRFAVTNPKMVARLALVALPVSGEAINDRLLQTGSLTPVSRVTERANNFPELEIEAQKSDPSAIAALVSELKTVDFSDDLMVLQHPLLLLFGDQDPLIQQPNGSYEIARQSRVDRAYINLPSCMHFPMLEEGAKFNRLLLEFLHAENDISHLSPKEYWKRRTY